MQVHGGHNPLNCDNGVTKYIVCLNLWTLIAIMRFVVKLLDLVLKHS